MSRLASQSEPQQQQQQQQYEPDHHQQEQQQEHANGGYDEAEDGGPSRPHVYPGGSRIDPDTLSYLTEVCEALSGMSDLEEAELLRSNVLEEIQGKELQLASDAASSTLMEQLLSRAPAHQLIQFMSAFKDGELLWRLAAAAFGSHVSEKVLAWLHAAAKAAAAAPAAADAGGGSSDPPAAAAAAAAEGPDHVEGLEELLEALVSGVEPHIVDYATDKHATHVVRALLVVLAGRDVLTPPGKKQLQRQQQQQDAEGEGEEGGQQQQQPQMKGVFGPLRSSLAEKLQGSSAVGAAVGIRYPQLLRRLVKALPLYDPQQMAQLGKNTYGGPLLQGMLRAAAQDETLLMLLLPPILGLDPSKAAAAAPGQRLATLTDSHVGRLLRDDCYSHLLEVAVAVMPQAAAAATANGTAAAGAEEQQGQGQKKKKKKRKAGEADGDQEQEAAAAAGAAGGAGGKGVSFEDEFYERFLKGRLLPLCCHHCANFVIQAALAAAHSRSRVAAYVSELSPHLADLLRRRRSGVVAALAAAAARGGPGPHQQTLVSALAAALGQLPQWQGRTGAAHLAPALVTLDTNAVLGSSGGSSGSSTRLSTPGCAMLALLLGQFPATVAAPFWDSLAVLPQSDLLRIARDPSGSRLLEAALAVAPAEGTLSKKKLRKLKKQQKEAGGEADAAAAAAAAGAADTAAVAARAAVLKKLRGSWGSIVQSPSGSFLAEAVFNVMTPDQAEALVAEVAAVHDQLMSRCSWGTVLAKKLGLEAYMRSPEEWRRRAAAAAATRKEFQELLASTGKHSKAAGHSAQQQQAQDEPPAHDRNTTSKKKRRRQEAEAEAAAAGEGAQDGAGASDAAAAAAEDASESNARKRARLAAAALAAAEAAEGGSQEEAGSRKDKKKQKKRKLEQAAAEAAAGRGSDGIGQPVQKKHKKDKQQAAEATARPDKDKKKRSRDSGGGAGVGVDLVALLSFGGLAGDKQHGGKKQKT